MSKAEQRKRSHRESRRSAQHRRPRAVCACAATEFAGVRAADFTAFPTDNLAAFSVSDFDAVTCRASAAILAALFLFFSAPIAPNAAACGMPTALPESPFMASQDYRLNYWESWGEIKVSPTVTMQIPVGFSPIPNRQYSRLLGNGWAFPILESVCYPLDRKTYEMRFPSGHRKKLRKTANANELKGGNWIAKISGTTITAKSSCNWSLVFNNGRLTRLLTPDGGRVEFFRTQDNTHTVHVNGNPVLTYKPDFDPVTTRRIARLTVKDGKETKRALLRFGSRPVLSEVTVKAENGSDKEVTQESQIDSLVSVKWEGEPERIYVLKTDELKITGSNNPLGNFFNDTYYKWDARTFQLTQTGDKQVSLVKIRGINCLKKTWPDGSNELSGYKSGVSIQQQRGGEIEIKESIRNPACDATLSEEKLLKNPSLQRPFHLPRKIFIYKDGKEELIRQHWYDETGKEIQLFTKKDGKGILYGYGKEDGKDTLTATNPETKELLHKKTFDASGKILEYKTDTVTYVFKKESETLFKIIRTNADGSEEKVVSKDFFNRVRASL